jgi:hypothetical protein
VGGTFPSANEKVLVLTPDRTAQERLLHRLATYMSKA